MLNTIAEISATRGATPVIQFSAPVNFSGLRLSFPGVRLHKRVLKIVNRLEILDRILVRLSKNTGADEIENHVTDIFRGTDPPIIKHRHHQRSEFLERILPDAFEQLRSRNM